MNKDECLTEEWWNAISNVAYAVPLGAALDQKLPSTAMALAVLTLSSFLRHLPRHLLQKAHLHDIFRGADFTAVGCLLLVLVCEQKRFPPTQVGLALLLYATFANLVYFAFDDSFPWRVAVVYYTVPLLFMLYHYNAFLQRVLYAQTGQLLLLVAVSVMLRMTEHKTVAPALGFHEGGTTCIPDHGMWHFASAALVTHVLYQLIDGIKLTHPKK